MARNYFDRHFSFFKQIFLFSSSFHKLPATRIFCWIQIHGNDDGKWRYSDLKLLVNEENLHECRKWHLWNPQRYNCVAIHTNDQFFLVFVHQTGRINWIAVHTSPKRISTTSSERGHFHAAIWHDNIHSCCHFLKNSHHTHTTSTWKYIFNKFHL